MKLLEDRTIKLRLQFTKIYHKERGKSEVTGGRRELKHTESIFEIDKGLLKSIRKTSNPIENSNGFKQAAHN